MPRGPFRSRNAPQTESVMHASGFALRQRSTACGSRLSSMTFTKRLRDLVRRGEITCSVRIWTRPHVKVGARYRMEEGHIEIDSIEPIGFRYYRGARARIRIPWRSRLAQDRQARPRPEYLFDPFSLCPCAPQTPLTALATSYSTDMPALPRLPPFHACHFSPILLGIITPAQQGLRWS